MSSQSHFPDFTLVIADSAKLLACQAFATEAPSLARLAGRGVVQTVDLSPARMTLTFAELSVLGRCGLLQDLERFPSAPLSAIATIDDQDHVTRETEVGWVHADAVHFSAGLKDLAGLQLRDEAQVTNQEHAALSEALRAHLNVDCEVVAGRPGHWLLKFAQPLNAMTRAPQHAFRGPLQEALPSGPDGAQLRRLMTELQMVLHDAAANRARARTGLPAINALWVWGLGASVATQATRRLPKAYGSSAYLKGLYSVHGKGVEAGDVTLERILNERAQDSILVVCEETEPTELQLKWFGPLERALRAGDIKSLNIDFDCWCISAKRADLLRFWRPNWDPTGQVT